MKSSRKLERRLHMTRTGYSWFDTCKAVLFLYASYCFCYLALGAFITCVCFFIVTLSCIAVRIMVMACIGFREWGPCGKRILYQSFAYAELSGRAARVLVWFGMFSLVCAYNAQMRGLRPWTVEELLQAQRVASAARKAPSLLTTAVKMVRRPRRITLDEQRRVQTRSWRLLTDSAFAKSIDRSKRRRHARLRRASVWCCRSVYASIASRQHNQQSVAQVRMVLRGGGFFSPDLAGDVDEHGGGLQ